MNVSQHRISIWCHSDDFVTGVQGINKGLPLTTWRASVLLGNQADTVIRWKFREVSGIFL